jgi:ankyrin repeat protein
MKATFRLTTVVVVLYVLTPFLAHSRSAVEARKKLAELLLPYSREAFLRSAEEGDTVAVQLFLEAGMEVDVEAGMEIDVAGEGGVTALMLAALQGHTATVNALLRAGADVNAATASDSWSALMGASRWGHTATVNALLRAGADVNAATASDGWSALMLAAARGHSSTVTALLAAGASVNAQMRNGKMVLTFAREQGHTNIVRLLEEAGAKGGGERERPSREASQQIRQAQKRLQAAGFDPGPIDGQLGPRTQAALRRYQTIYGLPATGKLDDATRKAVGVE